MQSLQNPTPRTRLKMPEERLQKILSQAGIASRRKAELLITEGRVSVNGKTVSESFSTAIQLRKAQREVAAYHRFRQLGQELLEVNERICRARPVADTLSPEEKKRRKPSSKRSRAK